MFREPRAPKLYPKSVILVTNGLAMARHGPILGEIEATPSGELLKHLPGPPGPAFGLKTTNKVENLGKSQIPVFSRRSEGFPHTRLFHPWARWGGAWWPGKVPCRCRATGLGPRLGPTTWQ